MLGWSDSSPRRDHGSHHIAIAAIESELRLTTDAPLSYLDGEPFALTERKHFVLAWGAPVEEPLEPLCDRFLRETVRYWQHWVKHCDIPPLYQEEVIRSALALKLHCFEDTGAIVAATDDLDPRVAGQRPHLGLPLLLAARRLLRARRVPPARPLRGARAVHPLPAQRRRRRRPISTLAPLYRIDGKRRSRRAHPRRLGGFKGEQPGARRQRRGARTPQHDVFGEMVLALTPMFLDARFREQVTPPVLDLVTRLARRAIAVAGQPDAGASGSIRARMAPADLQSLDVLGGGRPHDRIARSTAPKPRTSSRRRPNRSATRFSQRAVDPARGCLVADYGGTEVDAALLQAVTLRLLTREDPRLHATVDAMRADLEHDGWLRRYRTDDGFGVPERGVHDLHVLAGRGAGAARAASTRRAAC